MLEKEVDMLFHLIDVLKEEASYVFYELNKGGNEDDAYDIVAISNRSSFLTHERNCYKDIVKMLDNSYLDRETLEKLIEIRINKIKYYLSTLTINNIGTTLNVLANIYNDVKHDFLRHKWSE